MMLGVLAIAALGACLLTEPPGDRPVAQPRRPSIQHDKVSPKLTVAISDIPATLELVVPVDADPQAPLTWRLFVDFDPVLGGAQCANGCEDTIPVDPTLNPVRTIHVLLFPIVDTSRCHTLTLRVAQSFSTKSNWTPNPPGGDDATWFYRPNGNEAACPGFDAGSYADATAFDTGAE